MSQQHYPFATVLILALCGSCSSSDASDEETKGCDASDPASADCSPNVGGRSGSANSANSSNSATGGTTTTRGTKTTGGTLASGGSSPEGTDCAPTDMTGFSYPSYIKARPAAAACSDAELEAYYSDCYSSGNCSSFKSDGQSASCGECLNPTALESEALGPLLKLGTDSAYLTSTNLAGCIELVGEPDCAPKLQAAQLCEYEACRDACPLGGSGSYQSALDCMRSARSSVCAAVQQAAICIQSAAHVAACSGSSSKSQFMAVAKAFCQLGASGSAP